jgi:hypothetical protein
VKGVVSVAKPLNKRLSAASVQLYQHHAQVVNRYGRWVLVAWLAALADGKIFLAIATSTVTYHVLTSGQPLSWSQLEPVYQRGRAQLSRLRQTPWLASSLAFATTYGFRCRVVAAWR